jgi:hypothetical protein
VGGAVTKPFDNSQLGSNSWEEPTMASYAIFQNNNNNNNNNENIFLFPKSHAYS